MEEKIDINTLHNKIIIYFSKEIAKIDMYRNKIQEINIIQTNHLSAMRRLNNNNTESVSNVDLIAPEVCLPESSFAHEEMSLEKSVIGSQEEVLDIPENTPEQKSDVFSEICLSVGTDVNPEIVHENETEILSDDIISNLRLEINRLEKLCNIGDMYEFYLAEIIPCVDTYNHLLSTPVRKTFGRRRKGNPDATSLKLLKEKSLVIIDFLEIARLYYPLALPTYKIPTFADTILTCKNCSINNATIIINTDNTQSTCLDCGNQEEITTYALATTYRDNNRVNLFHSYRYEAIIHFRNSITKYQGKQNDTIPASVFEAIRSECLKHDLLTISPTGHDIYTKLTKDHIILFLKDIDSGQYENVLMIHHILTGEPLDDISYLEDTLEADFLLLMDMYQKEYVAKEHHLLEHGKSFKSTYYILYYLLKKHKHPCKKTDFTMLKTTDREIFYDLVCKDLFSKLKWDFSSEF
ncbi:MAG: hypothetical protein JKX76_01030 [Colwellia sp.]|nr:hypothetical protein [Colwellia sp.]